MLPIHPAALLQNAIQLRGYTPESFRSEARMPPRLFNAVLSGKRRIKLGTAMRLSRMLGTSPWVWIAFQQRYDKAI
ncbi:hypothetical protein [Ferrovibrio sp.]|uniref:helix-turn-helix transcriptional regulator n=1 Tax=Ferrovibrio sp. TaxID=1917215 RepID=UPI0025C0287A|nr:hypothetical protein [Ferrovibrio sp.]MBX3453971.1 hypothetical protein [Ferrovibrio sp.]